MTKQFKELTAQGQKARLTKYAKQRAEYGAEQCLATLTRPVSIKTNKDGVSKRASFHFAIYDKETKTTKFQLASAYIAEGKDALENFYAGLAKGDLVSIEYKMQGNFMKLYSVMKRQRPVKAKAE